MSLKFPLGFIALQLMTSLGKLKVLINDDIDLRKQMDSRIKILEESDSAARKEFEKEIRIVTKQLNTLEKKVNQLQPLKEDDKPKVEKDEQQDIGMCISVSFVCSVNVCYYPITCIQNTDSLMYER